MKPPNNDTRLDELITGSISRKTPAFDFDKWKRDHQQEIQQFREHSRNRKTISISDFNIWGITMQSKFSKYAAAAVIIIGVLIGINHFGGSIDGSSSAWAELVETLERTHNEYMEDLLWAVQNKDTKKINYYANLLDEFWQNLGWMATAELDQELRTQMMARIAEKKARYDKRDESDQVGTRIFLAYEDQFGEWLGKIEDVTWISETAHVCKQMEEYAEEIRDAAAMPHEEGLPYIEHCIASFIEYAGWFEQLPWDDTSEYVSHGILLTAIERDLEISRREILDSNNRDAIRFVKRCIQQAQKNVLYMKGILQSQTAENKDQMKSCKKLRRKIDEVYDLITYATIASWDIQNKDEIDYSKALRQVMTKEFANQGSFESYFLKQIDQSLNLCKQLSEGQGV
ncbi:MAG: hypothetical protein ACYTF1_02255 [Planctomycetota bacterium]|jgi:hypothetical protein